MRRVRGLSRISLSYNILPLFSADASIYVSFSPSYDRKAGRATVEIYGGIFINYNPATGDNTGEADDTFVAPGYKSVETTYNGQQAWQVIPE